MYSIRLAARSWGPKLEQLFSRMCKWTTMCCYGEALTEEKQKGNAGTKLVMWRRFAKELGKLASRLSAYSYRIRLPVDLPGQLPLRGQYSTH